MVLVFGNCGTGTKSISIDLSPQIRHILMDIACGYDLVEEEMTTTVSKLSIAQVL